MVNTHDDVVIIGGGVVGLSAAIAMHDRGYKVTVLDAGAFDATPVFSRVYALNHASIALLTALKVWAFVDSKALAFYHAMHVWDASHGACVDFEARLMAQDHLGVMVDENTIKRALMARLARCDVLLSPFSAVTKVDVHDDGVEIHCGDTRWWARWMIVADGGQSVVRTLLQVPLHQRAYQQSSIVAQVQTQNPHENVAYQVFHADGPLALLPTSDPHQCALVWSTKTPQGKMGLSEQEFNAALTHATQQKLGACALLSSRYSYPLIMRHVKHYVGKRWLLMGDAAHTIHPLAGLGLNLGLADLATWMHCMPTSLGGTWSPMHLGRYQRQRKHAVWQVIICMSLIQQCFNYPSLAMARGLMMRILQVCWPAKYLLMEKASDL